jgi:hypothetical protein
MNDHVLSFGLKAEYSASNMNDFLSLSASAPEVSHTILLPLIIVNVAKDEVTGVFPER